MFLSFFCECSMIASNAAEMLLLIWIFALFFTGCVVRHVPCHFLCFHQECFHAIRIPFPIGSIENRMLRYVACRWLGTRQSQRCETNGGDSQQSLPLVKLLLQKLVPLGLGDQPTEVHCGLYFFRAIRTHSTCTCCTRRRVTEKAWMAVLR